MGQSIMDPIFDALALVRWLHFSAMVWLLGGALFWHYAPGTADDGAPATRRLCTAGLRIAAPVALLTGAAWLAATIVDMTGGLAGLADPDTLHAFFLETIFGPIEVARMVLLLVLVVVAFAPIGDRRRDGATAALSAALLVSQAWLGHAAEGGASWHGALMVASYAAHVLAAAVWVGGLPLLLARIVELRRGAATPVVAITRLLSRYSLVATIAVAVVVASGVANTAFRIGDHIGALASSRYGGVLLVKVALVAAMLGFAAFNRFVEMPRLAAAARPTARIATSIGCEIALGLLVLAAAAILGITPPPDL